MSIFATARRSRRVGNVVSFDDAGQSANNIGNDFANQLFVISFRHHTNHGLRARGTDDDPSGGSELGSAAFDRGPDASIIDRISVRTANVLEDLRQGVEAMADLAHGSPLLHHSRQELQSPP